MEQSKAHSELITRMAKWGWAPSDIAKSVGRDIQTVHCVLEQNAKPKPLKKSSPNYRLRQWSIEDEASLRKWAAQGLTAKEAGQRLKRSRSAVLGFAWRNGIQFPFKLTRKPYSISRKTTREASYDHQAG
jgi:hypothetical protein